MRIYIGSIIQIYMDSLAVRLYQSTKSIFTNNELSLLWHENNSDNLNAKTAYYVKQKVLMRLTRGVFAKNINYSSRELATSIYTPSYISFETVLRDAGMIFQHYNSLYVASKWTKTVTIAKDLITIRKLKDIVLYNPNGVVSQDHYSIATPERAFLDMIYLFPQYYFDNLKSLNWEKCDEIAHIYHNAQLKTRLQKYRTQYA